MDIRMPGMSGIDATRRILAARPETRILILTMSEDDDSLFAAMRAGARGYLPKDSDSADLVRAIRAVAGGDVIFGESIATRLQAFFAAGHGRPAAAAFPELTDREDEVLELIARGHPNREIAEPARDQRQDGPQPRREHLQQAPGRRSKPGDHPRPRSRPRPGRRLGLTPVAGASEPVTRRRAAFAISRRRATGRICPTRCPAARDTRPMCPGHVRRRYRCQAAAERPPRGRTDGTRITDISTSQDRERRGRDGLPCRACRGTRALRPLPRPRPGRRRGHLPGGVRPAARGRPRGSHAGRARGMASPRRPQRGRERPPPPPDRATGSSPASPTTTSRPRSRITRSGTRRTTRSWQPSARWRRTTGRSSCSRPRAIAGPRSRSTRIGPSSASRALLCRARGLCRGAGRRRLERPQPRRSAV